MDHSKDRHRVSDSPAMNGKEDVLIRDEDDVLIDAGGEGPPAKAEEADETGVDIEKEAADELDVELGTRDEEDVEIAVGVENTKGPAEV